MHEFRQRQDVIGAKIDVVYWGGAIATLLRWAAAREIRYVCACNVHWSSRRSATSAWRARCEAPTWWCPTARRWPG